MIDGMMYNTLIVIDNYEMKEIHLDDRKSWTIGRNTENNAADIPIKSHRVSRKHGKFICESGIWFYFDTNSMNGTIYNGNKILPSIVPPSILIVTGASAFNEIAIFSVEIMLPP